MAILLLEVSEFIRALGFNGSDALFIVSLSTLLFYARRSRYSAGYWAILIYVVFVPAIYSITSERRELAIMAFSMLIFLMAVPRLEYRPEKFARAGWLLFLILISYIGSIGDPIYDRSSFNSLFSSGNAFVYYLLINGCIVAFCSRGIVVPAIVSAPFLMIQTKSVLSIALSNVRMFSFSLLCAVPFLAFFGLKYLDRILWFFNQYGVVYALGAGRVERFREVAASEFTWSVLLIGTPFPRSGENFEVEFIDIARDFGVPYALVIYSVCFYLINKYGDFRLLVLFVLLNLSGHFWNNPLLIIVFVGLIYYANSYNNKHVS